MTLALAPAVMPRRKIVSLADEIARLESAVSGVTEVLEVLLQARLDGPRERGMLRAAAALLGFVAARLELGARVARGDVDPSYLWSRWNARDETPVADAGATLAVWSPDDAFRRAQQELVGARARMARASRGGSRRRTAAPRRQKTRTT